MARSKITEEQVKDEDFMSEAEHDIEPHSLIDLTDTPTTYSGAEGQYLRATASGTEWATVSGGVDTFLDLSDTTSTYSGTEGAMLVSTGSDIEFTHEGVWLSGDGAPLVSDGNLGNYYVAEDSGIAYKKNRVLNPSTLVAKSVIFEFADNWGATSMGIRSIEFKLDGELIAVSNTNSTTYASTIRHGNFAGYRAFNTTYSKIGTSTEVAWQSHLGDSSTDQWLSIVFGFGITIEFDELVINNSHISGGSTTAGAKNTKIHTSSDEITTHTYGDSISNSLKISDFQLAEHVPSNVVDDQDINIDDGLYGAGADTGWDIVISSNIPATDVNLLELNDTPSTYDDGKYLKSVVSGTEWSEPTFLELTDTPTTYSGAEGQYLRATASGTEWATVASGVQTILDLTDTPSTYSGTEGAMLVSTGSGTNFTQEGRWLSGEGNPSDNLGSDGNMYLDTLNNAVHYRVISTILDEYTTNIALTGTASADSVYNGGDVRFVPGKANDGDTSGTRWLSDTGAPHWWQVDWAEVKYVSRIGVIAAIASAAEHFSEYYIEYWANGVWNESVHVTGYTDQRPTVTYHDIGENTDKMRIRTISGNDNHGLYEFIVYGGVETIGGWEEIGTFIANSSLLGLTDTPSTYDDTKYLISTASGTEWATVSSGVQTILDLTDTPSTYSGSGRKYVTVKEDETGLEFTPFTTMGPWVEVSSNYDAVHGQNLLLDSTVSGIVVSLPDNPTFGYSVAFADGAGNCSTHNVTISGGSTKILGLDENFVIDEDDVSFNLNYYNESRGWILGLVGHTTLTATAGSWTVIDANYTASNSDNLFLDSTVSGIEITLPSNPSMGYGVAFVDAEGNCTSNNVTVSSPDSKILGLSEDLAIDFDNAGFSLTYYDVANGWILGLVGHI